MPAFVDRVVLHVAAGSGGNGGATPRHAQLLAGECAMQTRARREVVLQRVKRAKFLKPIQPDQKITVCWREQPTDDGVQGSFTLLADGEKAATFTLVMTATGQADV